jgi:hypothetical protein
MFLASKSPKGVELLSNYMLTYSKELFKMNYGATMASLLGTLRLARAAGNKPLARQLSEACRLRFGKYAVGISEYFDYGISRQSVTPAMCNEFIGWKQSAELDSRLNARPSRVLANDKLINHVILQAAGLPSPTPLATYTGCGRRVGSEPLLTTRADVLAFLRGDVYPFYVKPISAGYGRGVMGVSGRDGDTLELFDGTTATIEQFMKPFDFEPYRGMLFQKPLAAHPAIAALTGTQAISCVRFICFVTSQGPVLHTAFWKITAGKNMLDNFAHGDYGNCLGAIDIASGTIVRAIAKLGPGGVIGQHPSTGQPLIGFALPDWERAVALVKAACVNFPGLRLQNWDVALCPQGPVLLELNTESELGVPQAISGAGLMDLRLRDILRQMDVDDHLHRSAVRSTQR